MASSKNEKITNIAGAHAAPEEASVEPPAVSEEAPSSEVQRIIVRQGAGWQTPALLFLSLLLLTTVGVAFYAFHRVGELNDQMGTTMRRVDQKLQNLDAGISGNSCFSGFATKSCEPIPG